MAGYFYETSHEDWSLNGLAEWCAINISCDKKKLLDSMKKAIQDVDNAPISETSRLMTKSMHANLEENLREMKDKEAIQLAQIKSHETVQLAEIKRRACGYGSGSESEEKDETEKVDDDSDDWGEIINFKDFSFDEYIDTCSGKRWCLNNGERIRDTLIKITRQKIEEANQLAKVDGKIMSVIRLGVPHLRQPPFP
ncbi:11095_t:CDS:2 [Dentiscutata erythropus]|uniref:11095_t:CDS:1 n=1 Tax=Dentiscutata erythropus TaxID=1348616 RepID=A0A9N9NKV6_9GLOM|nr:11095_t:CDS:2 [Dentiscutata erythropus]